MKAISSLDHGVEDLRLERRGLVALRVLLLRVVEADLFLEDIVLRRVLALRLVERVFLTAIVLTPCLSFCVVNNIGTKKYFYKFDSQFIYLSYRLRLKILDCKALTFFVVYILV